MLKYKQNPWPWLNHMCSAVTFHNICPIIQLPRITSNMYTTKKRKKNVCDFTSLTMQGGVVKQVIWLSANCFSWISSISYYLMDLASSKPIYLLFLWKLVNIGCLMQERWADSSSSSSSQYSLTISPLWITGQKAPYKAIKKII